MRPDRRRAVPQAQCFLQDDNVAPCAELPAASIDFADLREARGPVQAYRRCVGGITYDRHNFAYAGELTSGQQLGEQGSSQLFP